jgi:hypothetical protein
MTKKKAKKMERASISAYGKCIARDGKTPIDVHVELAGTEDNTWQSFGDMLLDVVHQVSLYYRLTDQQVLGYMIEHLNVSSPAERAAEQKQFDLDTEREPAMARGGEA